MGILLVGVMTGCTFASILIFTMPGKRPNWLLNTFGDKVVEVPPVVVILGSLDRCYHVTIRVLNGTRTQAWDE